MSLASKYKIVHQSDIRVKSHDHFSTDCSDKIESQIRIGFDRLYKEILTFKKRLHFLKGNMSVNH